MLQVSHAAAQHAQQQAASEASAAPAALEVGEPICGADTDQ